MNTTQDMRRRWIGDVPSKCDLCSGAIIARKGAGFVDGAVRGVGSWACMCLECAGKYSVGLGEGKGQRYEYDPKTGAWFKVGGLVQRTCGTLNINTGDRCMKPANHHGFCD